MKSRRAAGDRAWGRGAPQTLELDGPAAIEAPTAPRVRHCISREPGPESLMLLLSPRVQTLHIVDAGIKPATTSTWLALVIKA